MIEENCPNNERGEMLDQIRAYNFSVIELGLYLDINPPITITINVAIYLYVYIFVLIFLNNFPDESILSALYFIKD